MKKLFLKGIALALLLSLISLSTSGIALADAVYAVAASGKTFIRSVPGNTGEVLATMPEGARAEYLEESQTDAAGTLWYFVSYGSVSGWVSERSVRLSNDSEPYIDSSYFDGWPYYAIIEYPFAECVVARDGKSFIRSGPSTDARDLGTMPKGDIAAYLGLCCTDRNGREWYRVDYNGVIGWVSARYAVIE